MPLYQISQNPLFSYPSWLSLSLSLNLSLHLHLPIFFASCFPSASSSFLLLWSSAVPPAHRQRATEAQRPAWTQSRWVIQGGRHVYTHTHTQANNKARPRPGASVSTLCLPTLNSDHTVWRKCGLRMNVCVLIGCYTSWCISSCDLFPSAHVVFALLCVCVCVCVCLQYIQLHAHALLCVYSTVVCVQRSTEAFIWGSVFLPLHGAETTTSLSEVLIPNKTRDARWLQIWHPCFIKS